MKLMGETNETAQGHVHMYRNCVLARALRLTNFTTAEVTVSFTPSVSASSCHFFMLKITQWVEVCLCRSDDLAEHTVDR